MRVLGTLALLTCAGLLGCSVPTQNADIAFFEEFVRQIVAKDYERLQVYSNPKDRFFSDGKLLPEIEAFVYDGPARREQYPRLRSIPEIVQSGAHDIMVERQPDNRVMFYWIPKDAAEAAKRADFFEKEWMQKYFACEFDRKGTTYTLAYNFCFAETGGPHHPPYG